MKKSLLAFGLASALALSSAAQADVTVYGILDLGIVKLGGDGPDRTLLSSGSGPATSRVGIRGSEDLGGGLQAVFVLEAGQGRLDNPVGETFDFDRHSYAGLQGNFGQIVAGRTLTPLLYAIITVDPYIETFAGSPLNLGIQPTFNIRNSNTLAYTSPVFGGLRIRAMYTLGEAADSTADGRQFGLAAFYTAGPLGLVAALHSAESNPAAADTQDDVFAGVTYTLPNNTKVRVGYAQHDGIAAATSLLGAVGAQIDSENILVAASIPIGSHTIMPAYLTFDDNNSAAEASQIALAYTYAVSKRTRFFASWADIDNENGAAFTTFTALLNGFTNTSEFNVGIDHAF